MDSSICNAFLANRRYVRSLGTLRALSGFESHFLALREGFETISLDLRKVHEEIVAVLLLNKAETFLIGEPFDCSFWQGNSSFPLILW